MGLASVPSFWLLFQETKHRKFYIGFFYVFGSNLLYHLQLVSMIFGFLDDPLDFRWFSQRLFTL